MRNIVVILFCVLLGLTGCQTSGSKSNENNSKGVTDSLANDTSKVWYWVTYDDGFGKPTKDKYLQACITGRYTDHTVDKVEVGVFINVDPNIGKAILTFNNGTVNLKGQGEMILSIKDSSGQVYTTTVLNDENGSTYNISREEDILLKLLKTEKPISCRLEQNTYFGPVIITFQFENDNHFNSMLKEIPFRDESFWRKGLES